MGFFQNGELVYQVTSTATAGGTTTLSATSTQIQNFTGTLAQTIKLPPTTSMSVGQSYQIYNSSTGSLTIEYQDGTSFTPNPTVSASSSLVATLVSSGTTNGTWTIQSGSASLGSGSKNYLTAYTASTSSSTPNSGNGNFESGSTSGWSLAHSSLTSSFPSTVGSGGNAFSSAGGVHGGSAANANLSLSVVSSSQLAGSYSASYSSSTATTAGDMIISNAFFIDIEDQAKIMQFSIAYKAQTNPSNGNFSGTSSNSFAVAIYDVTNNAWIMPAGVYNLVQNSGVGLATGTFQTTSNSTQYQIALYNANASSGAITLYLDDFFVGPQIVQKGPAMSDWTAYTPTLTGSTSGTVTLGTTSLNAAEYRRVGDSVEVRYNFVQSTAASGGSGNFLVGLPSGLVADTTKMSASTSGSSVVGSGLANWAGSGAGQNPSIMAYPFLYDTQHLGFIADTTYGTQHILATSDFTGSTNGTLTFVASIPISGWSSNSVQSSDTDTRVVAAKSYLNANSGSITSGNPIPFNATVFDTHSAVTLGSSFKYTAPVSGYYQVNLYAEQTGGSASGHYILYKNGSVIATVCYMLGTTGRSSGSTTINLNAGDYIDMRADATMIYSGSTLGSGDECSIEIFRLSGPAVIAATESVNARYHGATATITGSDSAVTYTTKDFDSHSAYSGSTYTIPVSGKYQISIALVTTDASGGFDPQFSIYKNGSQWSRTFTGGVVQTATSNYYLTMADIVSCNAGDTIVIETSSSGTTPTVVASNISNFFCISRVGN